MTGGQALSAPFPGLARCPAEKPGATLSEPQGPGHGLGIPHVILQNTVKVEFVSGEGLVFCGCPDKLARYRQDLRWGPAPVSHSVSWLGQGARDIPQDSCSLLCQALCRIDLTSQGSHTSRLPAFPGSRRSLIGLGVFREPQEGAAGSPLPLWVLVAQGSDALQGPSPLRAGISATRWHCDPAEWQWMPESIVSGEISPPPSCTTNNLCVVCVPLAPNPPASAACCPEHPRPDSCFGLTSCVTQFRACLPRHTQRARGLPFTSWERLALVGGHRKGQLVMAGLSIRR